MFERFTDRARASVVLAQEEARLLNHSYIGTEHLLLGLLRESDGVAAKALASLGISLQAVRSQVEEIIGQGGSPSPPGHIPFTPRAKKVLELSLREALQLGHNYIGTEHILLGVIREGEGVAAQVLAKLGADLSRTRQQVVQLLSGHQGPTGRAEGAPGTARTPATQDVLRAAEQLAGGAPLGSHHLLVSLIQAEGSMAARALTDLGVEPEALQSKLAELRVEETTDITPEQAAARQMELRVEGDEVHVVLRDERTVELGNEVVGLAGGSVKGDGPLGGAFTSLWSEMQTSLARIKATLSAGEPPDKPARRRRKRPKREAS
jgi:ATP-dependent Clp protease ATP-binding subunit ClpA